MPKLRETYQQIKERNAREIKKRTDNRIRALQGEEELVVVQDFPETPIVIANQSYIALFALFAFLSLCAYCYCNRFIWLIRNKPAAW